MRAIEGEEVMATVQCDAKKHFYDDTKHSHCPHCPVPGLKDAKVPKTQAATGGPDASSASKPAPPPGASAPFPKGGTPGVTIAAVRRRTGIHPVCGFFVCIEGVNKGRFYPIWDGNNGLGREPDMDVWIEGDETISRENHCHIVYDSRNVVFSIVPGVGRNLVYLNGEPVLAAKELKHYDDLDIGEGKYKFLPFCSKEFRWEPPKGSNKPAEKEEVHKSQEGPGNVEPQVD
jgi:hypothetical protein